MMVYNEYLGGWFGDGGEAEEEVGSNFCGDALLEWPFEGDRQPDLLCPLPQHRVAFSHFPTELESGGVLGVLGPNECREKKRECGGPRRKKRKILYSEVSKLFYVPMAEAAKELKVGVTTLRKRCRELGIPRWPQRKLNSIKTLIRNLEDLGQEEWRAAERLLRGAIEDLEDDRLEIELSPELELCEYIKAMRSCCFTTISSRKRRARKLLPRP